jgi:Antirestriction protein (ArdA)
MTLDLTADIIDVRDIIERIEELETEIADWGDQSFNDDGSTLHDVQHELETLTAIMEDLKGNGGDEQWRGDWYPVTLIRDHYFTDYARELLEDCGDIPKDIPHYIAIDWDATADNIRVDYSSVEVPHDNRWVTYWYR